MQADFIIPQDQNIPFRTGIKGQKGGNDLSISTDPKATGAVTVDEDFSAILLGIASEPDSSKSENAIFPYQDNVDASNGETGLTATDEVTDTHLMLDSELVSQEGQKVTVSFLEHMEADPLKSNQTAQISDQTTQKAPVNPTEVFNNQNTLLKQESSQFKNDSGVPKGTDKITENISLPPLSKDLTENAAKTNIPPRVLDQATQQSDAGVPKGTDKITENTSLPHLSKDHAENAAKTDIPSRISDQASEKGDVIKKDGAVKFNSSDGDLPDSRSVRIDSDKGNNGLQSSNGQSLDRVQGFHVPAKETETSQKSFQTDTLKQIVDKAALNIKNGQTEIKIDLKPEILGHLRMQISIENHQVMLRMLTNAPLVREIIENNVNELKTALQNHGLEIDKFEVSVDRDSDQYDGGYKNPSFEKTAGEFGDREEAKDIIPEEGGNPLHFTDEGTGDNHIDFFA